MDTTFRASKRRTTRAQFVRAPRPAKPWRRRWRGWGPAATALLVVTGTHDARAMAGGGRVERPERRGSHPSTATTHETSRALQELVEVAAVNPGATAARDACVTIAVGPAAAYHCADLRLAHALPGVTTRGKLRTPLLTYTSQHAHPFPVVHANVALRPGVTQTDPVTVTLVVAGVTRDTRTFAPSGWDPTVIGGAPPGAARRITLGFNATALATGVYPYTVTVNYGGGVTVTKSAQLVIVNRLGSPFGAGWWLAGYERLHPTTGGGQLPGASPPADSILWVGGDGSARVYARAYGNASQVVYGTPARSYPDTLVWNSAGSTAGTPEWTRRIPGGASVRFTGDGLHWHTRDSHGQSTWFDHTGGVSRPSLVRPPSSNVGWALTYTSVSGTPRLTRVGQVRANGVPLVTGQPLDTLRFVRLANGAGAVDTIVDPDGSKVAFTRGGDFRVTSRRDRRGTPQSFLYDEAARLRRTELYATGGASPQLVAHTFCPNESQGLASCRPGPAELVYLATAWDGPRTNASDLTYFALDRFGAPLRVENALGNATVLTRGDARFPGLVTASEGADGGVSQAFYNARGLPDSVRSMNPLGDGRNATTKYLWHASLPAVTKITDPTGVVTEFGYDAATGNRLWQQTGGSTRRVDFKYLSSSAGASAHLLAAVLQPTVGGVRARDTVLYDPGLGNVRRAVSATSGRGHVRFARDVLGRVVAESSLAKVNAPGDTAWQVTTTAYDTQDRVLNTIVASTDITALPKTLVVEHLYDAESNVLRTNRYATPDVAGVSTISTEWRYDLAGRRVAEIAPDATPGTLADNPVDSTFYDASGLVDSVRTRRGHVIRMSYDALGRLSTRALPPVPYPPWSPVSGETQTFTYDVVGRLLTANNPDAQVTRDYWPGGALKQEELRVRIANGTDMSSHQYVTGYAYDLAGRRTGVTYPAQLSPSGTAATAAYAYDSTTGALARVTDIQANVYRFGYNLAGQLDSLALPGGIVERLAYEADGTLRGDSVFNRTPTSVPRRHAAAMLRASLFEHDLRGGLLATRNTAGLRDTLTASYDAFGHAVETHYVTNPAGAIPGTTLRFESRDAMVLDALGNLVRDTTLSVGRLRDRHEGPSAGGMQYYRYQSATGRLTRMASKVAPDTTTYLGDTLTYDAAGNVASQGNPAVGVGGIATQRQSRYAADGTLRMAMLTAAPASGNPSQGVTEEHRYDALGRRVWVRARRSCTQANGDQIAEYDQPCSTSLVRRTVWDGSQELGEFQAPGDAFGTRPENDTGTLWPLDNGQDANGADPNRFFGRVAYTHALGVDRPLAVLRLGYVDAPGFGDGSGVTEARFAPFTVVPLWTTRGAAENGSLADGSTTTCQTVDGAARCVALDWPDGWYAYDRAKHTPRAWHGTLLEDKRDAAGTLYRRNRHYDPATGRFTQEDPIGLAGGVNLYGYAGGDPVNRSDPFGLTSSPTNLPDLDPRGMCPLGRTANQDGSCLHGGGVPTVDPTRPHEGRGEPGNGNQQPPSCRSVVFSGLYGYIAVQTSPQGTISWGIYMYARAADAGPWFVNVFVDKMRVDYKSPPRQIYAPHGSVSPNDAPSGSVLRIEATHTDLAGRTYNSVPNACVIP